MGTQMKRRLTQEDYAAFADLRRESLRSQIEARALEQAREGGPPLTEMGISEINQWLREFHSEAQRHLLDVAKADSKQA